MTVNSAELTANLKFCSAIFVEKLIVSFGDEAINQLLNTSTLQAKRELLQSLIMDSKDDDDTIPVMMEQSIREFAEFVKKNEQDLKVSRDAAKTAKENYDNDKQNYKDNAQVKIDALDKEFEIDQEKWDSYQLGINKVKAKELRKKVRHRGLVALAKGAIAATIDGVENEYFKTANVVMTTAIRDTKNVMRIFQEDGAEVETVEGYKAIEEAVVSNAKKTSKDTDGGKNVTILNAQMETAKASMAFAMDLSSGSLKALEDRQREHNQQRIVEHMNS